MQEIFLLEDVLNVLIELENLGSVHYHKMAEMTEDSELKGLFARLSVQELAHKEIYEDYKKQKINFEEQTLLSDYKDYMDALLKNAITFLNTHMNFKDFKDGFEIAVKLEKETLLFLSEIKVILGKAHHEAIDKLMNEERKHLRFLLNYK